MSKYGQDHPPVLLIFVKLIDKRSKDVNTRLYENKIVLSKQTAVFTNATTSRFEFEFIESSHTKFECMYMSEFEYELTEFKYEQKFRNIEFIAACVSNFSRTPEDNVYTCLIKTRL